MTINHYVLILLGCCFVPAITTSQVRFADQFLLEGKVDESSTGILILRYIDGDGVPINDTVELVNDSFKFVGYIKEPTVAQLDGDVRSNSVDDPNRTNIFLEQGRMTVNLFSDQFKDAIVTGSYAHNLLRAHNLSKRVIYSAIDSLKNVYLLARDSLDYNMKENRGILDTIDLRIEEMIESSLAVDRHFIQRHPDQIVSAFLLSFQIGKVPLDTVEYYYTNLHSSVQYTSFGQEILTQMAESRNTKNLNVGDRAPSQGLIDLSGSVFMLDELWTDSYVLLDVWATWCLPCMEMNTLLQEIYRRYHEKGLQIVGLSVDFDRENWEKEIANHNFDGWRQVLLGLDTEEAKEFRSSFGVLTIPTYILIDKDGTVLGRYNRIDQDADFGLLMDLKKYLD